MRTSLVVLALITLPPLRAAATPPIEDEAHRLDRLETKRLNERAAARVAATPIRPKTPIFYGVAPVPARTETAAEAALRRREAAAIAAWRGDRDSCRAARRRRCR